MRTKGKIAADGLPRQGAQGDHGVTVQAAAYLRSPSPEDALVSVLPEPSDPSSVMNKPFPPLNRLIEARRW